MTKEEVFKELTESIRAALFDNKGIMYVPVDPDDPRGEWEDREVEFTEPIYVEMYRGYTLRMKVCKQRMDSDDSWAIE